MKVRIFSKGKGWYISATNYKNREDKAYMSVRFPMKDEPIYKTQERGFDFTDIDVIEAKFEAKEGKMVMSVFKYMPVYTQPVQQTLTGDGRDVTGHTDVNISPEELPFY